MVTRVHLLGLSLACLKQGTLISFIPVQRNVIGIHMCRYRRIVRNSEIDYNNVSNEPFKLSGSNDATHFYNLIMVLPKNKTAIACALFLWQVCTAFLGNLIIELILSRVYIMVSQ